MRSILVCCTLLLCSVATNAQRHPNIIFILADDLGYGDVGYQGQLKIHTPNIDRMAADGMRFSYCYAGTAVCAPSRASFVTGLHTGRTPIRGNRGFKPEGQYPLPDSALTIATVLQKHGYTTGAFGKWGLGYPGSTGTPDKQGFTDFFGYNCQTLAHNYYPDHLWSNTKKIGLPGTVYSADLIHNHALKFLKDNKDHPFFLFCAYTLPHARLQVPHDSVYASYVAQFHDTLRAAYAAMVTRLDRYVGEIRAQVQALGLAGNTLILFSSDNGPHHEGGNDPAYFQSSGGLRGIKRDLYEGGIREPFAAVWPGHIRPGAATDRPFAFWDLFPTFEQVAGIPITKNIDGYSILPVLEGHPEKAKQHDYFYWEFHESGGRQAVRWGKWKGVRLNVNTIADPPVELYDLEKDPGEKNNIAAQHPDIVQHIKMIMTQAHHPNKDWPLLASELNGKEPPK
ncbi:MAG TPA: arylsulfatase [Puia sp.]|nr:arylsulfatase [Puia sp.]